MLNSTRLVVVLVVVAAVAWLGFRTVRAFDQDRHAAEAAAVLSAPDTVTHRLPPAQPRDASPQPRDASPQPRDASPQAPDAGAPEREGNRQPGGGLDAVHTPEGRLSYRRGTWLSVVDLEGLEAVTGGERYLVFLRNWAGWTLAGAATPSPDGAAQVRSGAEPRPPTIYEVIVTRAVDDATSVPHGRPMLHWYEPSLAPPKARPFDFARGA